MLPAQLENDNPWNDVKFLPVPAYRRVECLLDSGVTLTCYQSPPEIWTDAGVRVTGAVVCWRYLPRDVEFPPNDD